MKTLWNEADREVIDARLARLAADTPARWGRMRAPQMLAHLTQSMRMATGELAVKPKSLFIRHTPFKQLIIYVLPFPKGTPTAPELLARTPEEWGSELSALRASIDAFTARPRELSWPDHPAFGRLSPAQWGVLQYRHADHHLRQFGV
jgi:hypothetical protein